MVGKKWGSSLEIWSAMIQSTPSFLDEERPNTSLLVLKGKSLRDGSLRFWWIPVIDKRAK